MSIKKEKIVCNNKDIQEDKVKTMADIMKDIVSKKRIELMSSVVVIITLAYQIINYVHNMKYQTDCEKFYNVPGKYFSESVNKSALYMAFMLLLIMLAIIPVIMRRVETKKKAETRGFIVYIIVFTIFLSTQVGIVNVYNLELISNRFFGGIIDDWINDNVLLTFIMITVILLIALLGIVFLEEIKRIYNKLVKQICSWILFISCFISLMLMIVGSTCILATEAKYKTKYEFVNIDNEKYIVVTECNDKKIVMKYTIDKDRVILDIDNYYFIDDQATFSYIKLKHPPKGGY